MNKKAKKRAFLVFALLSLLYISVTFRFPEKVSMVRTSEEHTTPSHGMILPVSDTEANDRASSPPPGALSPTAASPALAATQEATRPESQPAPARDRQPAFSNRSEIEPSLLISVPVVCCAIKGGWIEKESLIFGKKDAYNNVTWKKPIEILKDHDEEGIKSILATIGQQRVREFMRNEGLRLKADISTEDMILGKGYRIDEQKLVALYNKYVGGVADELLPYSLGEVEMVKAGAGFEIARVAGKPKDDKKVPEAEWMMPNLANLPLRLAIARLSAYTGRIRVYGNGHVASQFPKAFERLKGEQECVIQGRRENE